MVEVLRFKPGHLDLMAIKDAYIGDKTLIARTESIARSHIAHTLLVDNQVIAVVGGIVIWPGVCEMWTVTSPLVSLSPLGFHREIRKIIDFYVREKKLHRIHATVKCAFKAGLSWVEALGFVREGTLKQYGPEGADYYMYARLY